MALTAALQATTAKKHLVAAAMALKQGRTGDADVLLGQALDALGQALDALAQAKEETTAVRNTIVDRRTSAQKHGARRTAHARVPRGAMEPDAVLAALSASLRRKDAA
jgi:hypothetical protein